MGFSNKRGRPRLEREKNDMGTKELQAKIARDFTTEPLDLALKKKLITQEEHQAGIRLRWLYTLRFGSPDVSAYSLDAGASCFRNDNDEWLKARYAEYENILHTLETIQAKRIIVNVCIFNLKAAFLLPYTPDLTSYELRVRRAQFLKFKGGMEVIAQ
jgi:hypothetical protein